MAFCAGGLAAAPAPGPAEPAKNLVPPELTASRLDSDFDGNLEASGGVRWQQGLVLMTADLPLRTPDQHRDRLGAGHPDRRRGAASRRLPGIPPLGWPFFRRAVRIGRYPVYIQGASAEGKLTSEMTIKQAIVTYHRPRRLEAFDQGGNHHLFSRALCEDGQVPDWPQWIRPWSGRSSLQENLNQAISTQLLTFSVGYRSSLGGDLFIGVHYPVFSGDAHVGAIWESTPSAAS